MGLEALRQQAQDAPTLDNLRALRDGITAELRSIHEQAGDSELTGDTATRWDELTQEHAATVERIDTEERAERVRESRARWQSTQFGTRVEPFDGRDVRSLGSREVRDKALKVLDLPEHTEHLSDAAKAQVSRHVRAANGDLNGAHIAQRLLLTENEHYRSAFMRLVTRPYPVLDADQIRAVQTFEEWRSMSIGSDSAGGYGVPVLIDPTIILTAQGHPNDILGLARVETITTDTWKGVTSAGVTWKFRAEASATTDGSPTLAQPTVPTHRADGTIPFSVEVEMDYPSFATEVGRLLDAGYAELLVNKLTNGSGTNEPTGIETALDANTNVEVATTTAGTIGAADVNGLWAALPIRYRNPAVRTAWMSHTGVNNDVQQLGSGNDAAFTVSWTAEGVAVLKGRPYFVNDYLDDVPSGTAAGNLLVVGAWENFLVAQRAGMQVELIPHKFDVTNNMPTGERFLFAWARVGSDSINDLAFRMLQNKTS